MRINISVILFFILGTLQLSAQRVVSLSPIITQLIVDHGREDALVGSTCYCDLSDVADVSLVGSIIHPDTEAILCLRPEVVLASTMTSVSSLSILRSLGLNVCVFDIQVQDGLNALMNEVSSILGSSSLMTQLEPINSPVKSVFFGFSPGSTSSCGPGTYIDTWMMRASLQNVPSGASSLWPRISLEYLLDQDPDCLIFASDQSEQSVASFLNESKLWSALSAVKHNRILCIPPVDIYTNPYSNKAQASILSSRKKL